MVSLISKIVSLCAMLAGALILAVCGVTFYEVVARYAFHAPTTWSIDVSIYGVFWATFLGSPYALREGGHVAVDVVVEKLDRAVRNAVARLIFLSITVFSAVLAWAGWTACVDAYRFGEVTMSVLRFPLYLPMAALPVGCALLATQAALMALQRMPARELGQ